MTEYLLDANATIALAVKEHVHRDAAQAWFAGVERAAITPVVEGALVRYLVRIGVGVRSVARLLDAIHADARIEFWRDELSYRDVDLGHVVGHRQVTDAYLAASASSRDARLATFDRALASTLPERTVLIPGARPVEGFIRREQTADRARRAGRPASRRASDR
ncbi:PIN domain-containing protein [Microbacterium sp.]|uniref:PIN domain-containing protein n=1 Tax=Microbacterium sp. TaxID=51671 RepID=UPI003C731F91